MSLKNLVEKIDIQYRNCLLRNATEMTDEEIANSAFIQKIKDKFRDFSIVRTTLEPFYLVRKAPSIMEDRRLIEKSIYLSIDLLKISPYILIAYSLSQTMK